jgi:ASC-1-like (ASCH) protein
MKHHVLKIENKFINFITSGAKTFEFRKNDRDYKIGDIVSFYEPKLNETYESIGPYIIEYILTQQDFKMVPEGWVIFSIRALK